MTLRLSDILQRFQASGLILELRGDDAEFSGFAGYDDYTGKDVLFVDDPSRLESIKRTPPAGIVVDAKNADTLNGCGLNVLIASNVSLAHALIRQAYDDIDPHDSEWPRIHPSSVIHESAEIPESATIGPNVVIGGKVTIGERVAIHAGSVIERDVIIGPDTIVQSKVFIGWGCRIGARVRIKPGTTIGGEGFGLAPDEHKHYHRIPHRGIVVIEDDVIIGANCNIDRATYTETRIGRRCRLDALCHVAHNVVIDEDCLLVAQTGLAGSVRFGKRVIASGQTGAIDHKTVTDDVVLVHRAGVTEDITEPGMYAATPTQPYREYMKNLTVSRKLHELRKKVLELEKELNNKKKKK